MYEHIAICMHICTPQNTVLKFLIRGIYSLADLWFLALTKHVESYGNFPDTAHN